jgi:hypothetical protein|tara:strand:+ start:236 stop:1309 length:1074 start_codon:yes stop_codon:yes gene_type:complete
MACTLSNTGVQTGCTILATQISQSITAFTKAEAYDISISGSLIVTGSTLFSSSNGAMAIQGIGQNTQNNVLTYNCNNGSITFACCDCFTSPPATGAYITGSGEDIRPIAGQNSTNNCDNSGIGSGANNNVTSSFSYIGGGRANSISTAADCSIIGGGAQNKIISADNSAILGGLQNTINQNSSDSVALGGVNNEINRCGSTHLIHGRENIIEGNGITNNHGTILNGCCNKICGNTIGCSYNTILNGEGNIIENSKYSTILGGLDNKLCATGGNIIGNDNEIQSTHVQSVMIGACLTSVAACTTHVNNLNVACTTQMQLRDPLGSGQAGMLVACDAGGGVAELYFHNGTAYKKVCLVP